MVCLVGNIFKGKSLPHRFLGIFYLLIYACRHSRKHGRPESASLFASRHFDGHTQYIRQRLHDKGRFERNTPYADYLVNLYSVFKETVNNGFGTKGGGFHQGAEY